jgi:hypothetical protein
VRVIIVVGSGKH